MDAFRVLVQFRAPCAPSDADHFRHVEQQAFGDRAHSRGSGKRNAGLNAILIVNAFVEGRKERALQAERARTGAQHRQRRDAEQQSPVSEGKPERRMVRRLELADEPALPFRGRFIPGSR